MRPTKTSIAFRVCEASHRAGQTFKPEAIVRHRRWFVAIVMTMAAISFHDGASALSNGSPSASITQSETAPPTVAP
jgi:hypothetical protein